MAIKYYLQPNAVTPDPDDQFARVQAGNVYNLTDVIALMLKRGSTITESDSKAVLTMFFKVVIDEVSNGNFVNLPILNARCGINGVFKNVADNFDASRHSVRATLSAGNELWEAMLNAKVEKLAQPTISPYILQYEDVNSHTFNTIVTKGGIGIIRGNELKFELMNPTEGIFFVDATGAAIKVTIVATRTMGKLTFNIPTTLAVGTYNLEVRKAYTQVNSIRIGVLAEKLTVA